MSRVRTPAPAAPRLRRLLPVLLTGALWSVACDGQPPAQRDGSADASGLADARPDAGPDAAILSDAGTLQHFDASIPPCDTAGYFSEQAARISLFRMSPHAFPTWGLDLDNDLTTCNPSGDCCCGVDNQLGGLHVEDCWSATITADGFNDNIMDGIVIHGDPPVSYLLEARGLTMIGQDSAAPFTLVLHEGQLLQTPECTEDASVLDDSLRCDYLSKDIMFQPGSCDPVSTLDNAEIINGRLSAGGPSHNLWIAYTALGLSAGLVVHQARIEAEVIVQGDRLTVTHGILGGAICTAEMMLILNAALNTDPACGLESKLPQPDLEIGCTTDSPDGISLAFVFEAHAAHIVGLLRE